jgi:predicted protein tyrosine phosphatase
MSEHRPLLQYDKTSAVLNAKNEYQGRYKRVLCVCSAGLLRSATAAVVLAQAPFNYNTRSVGSELYALIPITVPLLFWADEIVCMSENHKEAVLAVIEKECPGLFGKKIYCLNVPDSFAYRDPELMQLIAQGYKEHSEWVDKV